MFLICMHNWHFDNAIILIMLIPNCLPINMRQRVKKIKMFIILICTAGVVLSDRGSISFRPKIKIFEPKQRALIGWDGKEEILLLSTDLRASEPTKVLEVLPLPSEPVVVKGDVEVFKKATHLINKKTNPDLGKRSKSRGAKKGALHKAGEITFHKKIGAHDIAVAHVLNNKGFIQWVENYLKKNNVETPVIPKEIKDVISDYINDGFSWFAFDVIELDTIPKTNDAIQYRFKSKYLYYPLRITKAENGHTSIKLLILTPKLLVTHRDKSYKKIKLLHSPIDINLVELKSISEDIANLLGNPENMKLRIWEINGDLKSFNRDLMAIFRY